ncbi:MAG: DUF305 domain-containing protein [Mesorhizobium sp.]|uniref:CopM family metallochaperone n=1 Tax=Mesorhizobium sp. TaxID=1871066 RepID=UPI0012095745|nr:DUF305 domain-containing protein [Mesorhizobium sp.]TIR31255.1 MAG: DUF305 domain-containing protein [Mesorhizobium sp.]TIS22171.1 MAG: DUF305 domain-containing protein [Mesorhizobium sp.]
MASTKLTFAMALLLSGFAPAAFAQQSSDQPMDMAPSPLPEQCGQAEGASAGHTTPGMAGMDMSGMDEAHKANMAAMMKMHPAMMQEMMAKDPDVAFACGMIAHHQGAIDMAEVELKYGDNDEAKKMAQKIIDAQTNEIGEFKQWLDANAK